MIQQTKEFPMILTEVIIKKTTVMAKAADVDIMKFKSVRVPDLKNNEQVNKWSSKCEKRLLKKVIYSRQQGFGR